MILFAVVLLLYFNLFSSCGVLLLLSLYYHFKILTLFCSLLFSMLHTKKTDSFKSQHTQKETNIDSITNLATPMSDIRFLLRKGPKTANLQMHGALADPGWDDPVMVAQCSEVARPGYDSVQAHEYLDTPRTLKLKVKLLAKMLKKSSATVLYTGAGISTASGTSDYASKAKNSKAPHIKKRISSGNRLLAQPTYAHHCCAALQTTKSVGISHWLEQNHDRLALKAGFPKSKLNEIHGAWGDIKNSVKMMDDKLRGDLVEWMLHWEQHATLCIAMGTSLCGMYADSVADACAGTPGKSLVIINLQATQYDATSSLRIWGVLDDVMKKLAKELNLRVPNINALHAGKEWESKHPRCRHNTSKRKPTDKK